MIANKQKILSISEGDVVTFDDTENLKAIWQTPCSSSDQGMGPSFNWPSVFDDVQDADGSIDYKKVEINLLHDLKQSMKSKDCELLKTVQESKMQLFEEEADLLNKMYVTISLHVAPTHDYQLMYQCAMGQIKCSIRFKTEIEVFNSVATALMLVHQMTNFKLDEIAEKIIEHCTYKFKPYHLDYLDSLFQLKRKWHVNYQRDGWGEQLKINEYVGHFKKTLRWLSEVRVRDVVSNPTAQRVPGAVVDFSTAIELIEALIRDTGVEKAVKNLPAEFFTLLFLGYVGVPPNSASLLDLCVGYVSEGFNPGDQPEILVSAYCCTLVIRWGYKHLRTVDKPRWFEDFICLTSEAHLCVKWKYYELNYFDEFRVVYLPENVAEKGRTARCVKLMPFKIDFVKDEKLTNYKTMRQFTGSKKGFVFLGQKIKPDEESGFLTGFDDGGFSSELKDKILFSFLRVLSVRQSNAYVPKRIRATKSIQESMSQLQAYV